MEVWKLAAAAATFSAHAMQAAKYKQICYIAQERE
jgi:hypothetical protein